MSLDVELSPHSPLLQNGCSFSNKLILEAYNNDKIIKTENRNGLAFVDQKTKVKPLKLLVNAKLIDGTVIAKGSKAYVKEEQLFSQPWAKKILESDSIEGKFIVVDIGQVEFILP